MDLSFLYWANICSNASYCFGIILCVSLVLFIAVIIPGFVFMVTDDDFDEKLKDRDYYKCFKFSVICAIVAIISSIVLCFIPTDDTVYTMGISDIVFNSENYENNENNIYDVLQEIDKYLNNNMDKE